MADSQATRNFLLSKNFNTSNLGHSSTSEELTLNISPFPHAIKKSDSCISDKHHNSDIIKIILFFLLKSRKHTDVPKDR